MKFNFGPEFQDAMLSLALRDLGFASKLVEYISEENLWSDAHRFVFNLIKEKIEHAKPLSYIEVEERLKKIDRSKRRAFKSQAKKIFDNLPENPEFIKDQLTDFARKCMFIKVFQAAQTFWNMKDHTKAYDFTLEGMNELYAISFEDSAIVPIENFEEMRQLHIGASLTSARKIPTIIPALDEALRGGLEKGELGILLAEPKKGKSIGLAHMGYAAITTGFGRVAHFVLEGTTEQTILRYLSRLSGIEYSRLEQDEITDEEQRTLDYISKKYMSKLDLIPFNQHWNYSVIDIESKIKELKNRGKNPDLIVVDYADLLKADGKHESFRHEQTEVYRSLKRLAVMGKYAIWTASQAQRPKNEPDKAYLLRSKDISESYEKVRIADLVATLNQTPKEKTNGVLRFHLDIYRSSDADKTIKMLVNFEKMIFYSTIYGHTTKADYHDWMDSRRGR